MNMYVCAEKRAHCSYSVEIEVWQAVWIWAMGFGLWRNGEKPGSLFLLLVGILVNISSHFLGHPSLSLLLSPLLP